MSALWTKHELGPEENASRKIALGQLDDMYERLEVLKAESQQSQ